MCRPESVGHDDATDSLNKRIQSLQNVEMIIIFKK